MYIKELYIQEKNNYYSKDSFSTWRTIIMSERNSIGKTTYLRLLLFSLGYAVPGMKGLDYSDIITRLVLEEKGKEYIVIRQLNILSLNDSHNEIVHKYILPDEFEAFLGYVFQYDNLRVLRNILGVIYIDQDKGWSLLNRGKVIGKIKFSIEELLAGLNDVDCEELIEEQKQLRVEKDRYQTLINLQELNEELYERNHEINIPEEVTMLERSISLLKLKEKTVKNKIQEIESVISSDQKFFDFLEQMNLEVEEKQISIPVNKNTLKNANYNIGLLEARKSLLITELEKINKQKIKNQKMLGKYYEENTILSPIIGYSGSQIVNEQLAKIHIDQELISGLLEVVSKKLRQVNKEIKQRIKFNNSYIDSIYSYVVKYAKYLEIEDVLKPNADYILTDDIKSVSGARLSKLVFAFKLAFLKVIEKDMNTKIPFILDSPRSKELDSYNTHLIERLIEKELKDNQVIIASIFKFSGDKYIIIHDRAIENRNDKYQ